jgi:hypothetical protein
MGPGCFARGNAPLGLGEPKDDAGPSEPPLIEAGLGDVRSELPPLAPHAVLGIDPSHGPFSGGQLALIRGNGFGSDVRVWFGDNEVVAADVVPVDPGRVQVVVPPGRAGLVGLSAQNGGDASTRAELVDGYEYDRFYASPSGGPTSGGTLITLHGDGTHWDASTQVFVDLAACEIETLIGETELVCRVPPGTAGSKPIRVTTSDGVSIDVLDAFTYGDSDNGFRGGLAGSPLDSELRVLALDSFTGNALPSASVVLDADLASVQQTGGSGIAIFQGSLGPHKTVTVAKKCYQPITFVDVPVDRVTAYLRPVLSPACGDLGSLPLVGGTPSAEAPRVQGELVWQSAEFQRSGWSNVPPPKTDDEALVAYVFRLSSDPTRAFELPAASQAITPDSNGDVGFGFSMTGTPGNTTLYALAGLENRALSPPVFTPYAMGVTKGVALLPGETTKSVYIAIDLPLDQALSVRVTGPQPTSRGPDRLRANVAIRVNEQGYAILPSGSATRFLPITEPIELVGLPPLVGSLLGARYVTTGRAFTGEMDSTPRSVVGTLAALSTAGGIDLDQFVEIPVLEVPGTNGEWAGTELRVSFAPGGAAVDLTVYEIQSGGGLVGWQIAAPAGKTALALPDLRALDAELALRGGPITVSVSAAHIKDFNYGTLRYRHLGTSGWTAYAQDVFFAHY